MTESGIEEQLRKLLAEGEGSTLEYKSSLRWDYNESRVNKDLAKVIVKTLAAFLNSQGGTLLIGVNDEGGLLDLEMDISTLGRKGHLMDLNWPSEVRWLMISEKRWIHMCA